MSDQTKDARTEKTNTSQATPNPAQNKSNSLPSYLTDALRCLPWQLWFSPLRSSEHRSIAAIRRNHFAEFLTAHYTQFCAIACDSGHRIWLLAKCGWKAHKKTLGGAEGECMRG